MIGEFLFLVATGVTIVAVCGLFRITYNCVVAKVRQTKERRSQPKDRRS
jgi:hypothetical protein